METAMILKIYNVPGGGRGRKLQETIRIAKQNLGNFPITVHGDRWSR
jgi:hypothetical protein